MSTIVLRCPCTIVLRILANLSTIVLRRSYSLLFLSFLVLNLLLGGAGQGPAPSAMGSVNRHPADRLADVRAAIRELEEEEAALRTWLLENRDDLAGDEHIAVIASQDRRRLDLKGLADEIGRSLLDRFTITSRVTILKVRERG